jgi:hypothetical protein
VQAHSFHGSSFQPYGNWSDLLISAGILGIHEDEIHAAFRDITSHEELLSTTFIQEHIASFMDSVSKDCRQPSLIPIVIAASASQSRVSVLGLRYDGSQSTTMFESALHLQSPSSCAHVTPAGTVSIEPPESDANSSHISLIVFEGNIYRVPDEHIHDLPSLPLDSGLDRPSRPVPITEASDRKSDTELHAAYASESDADSAATASDFTDQDQTDEELEVEPTSDQKSEATNSALEPITVHEYVDRFFVTAPGSGPASWPTAPRPGAYKPSHGDDPVRIDLAMTSQEELRRCYPEGVEVVASWDVDSISTISTTQLLAGAHIWTDSPVLLSLRPSHQDRLRKRHGIQFHQHDTNKHIHEVSNFLLATFSLPVLGSFKLFVFDGYLPRYKTTELVRKFYDEFTAATRHSAPELAHSLGATLAKPDCGTMSSQSRLYDPLSGTAFAKVRSAHFGWLCS